MPCIIQQIDKTHHLPLDPCVIVIVHVYVAFVHITQHLLKIGVQLYVDINNIPIATQHRRKKFRTFNIRIKSRLGLPLRMIVLNFW